ncbi:hypothetical protein RFI_27050 [Reticulomyxa filosa]|uniref:Uncharacterized protein n=1 Tax=Reticulomyxa filosa TaxID=46433 RepID=X6MA27_RETFI|nr:hypothetical protein RFI_27050 [Reticulomyxa filosa]|eukprot:ETO10327.1 hypothetical protein RFI_27050 [Reticulomyxa filosa]
MKTTFKVLQNVSADLSRVKYVKLPQNICVPTKLLKNVGYFYGVPISEIRDDTLTHGSKAQKQLQIGPCHSANDSSIGVDLCEKYLQEMFSPNAGFFHHIESPLKCGSEKSGLGEVSQKLIEVLESEFGIFCLEVQKKTWTVLGEKESVRRLVEETEPRFSMFEIQLPSSAHWHWKNIEFIWEKSTLLKQFLTSLEWVCNTFAWIQSFDHDSSTLKFGVYGSKGDMPRTQHYIRNLKEFFIANVFHVVPLEGPLNSDLTATFLQQFRNHFGNYYTQYNLPLKAFFDGDNVIVVMSRNSDAWKQQWATVIQWVDSHLSSLSLRKIEPETSEISRPETKKTMRQTVSKNIIQQFLKLQDISTTDKQEWSIDEILSLPIETVNGCGEKVAYLLHKENIQTIGDMWKLETCQITFFLYATCFPINHQNFKFDKIIILKIFIKKISQTCTYFIRI